MKLVKNPDTDWVAIIENGLKQNNGYCPCAATRTDATKCICTDFRQKLNDPAFVGYCHCRYYRKDLEDDSVQPNSAATKFTFSEGGVDAIYTPCLTGDTLIATETGNVFIRDLVGVSTRIYGIDNQLYETTGAFSVGIKTIATLTTQHGHFIRATLKQEFLTTKGDKEMRYLTLDDELLTADGTTTRMESMRLSGSEEVFDLVTFKTSHFIANGLTMHNNSNLS